MLDKLKAWAKQLIMRNYLFILLISLFFISGCNNYPIYELEENVGMGVVDGTEYALHKLSNNGKTYISEPEQIINPDYYNKLEIGKQIGKTKDGLQVRQVKNDENRVVIYGFMFPADFYKLDGSS